jgi:O-antigen/teichoic acid export membrane protein
VNNTTLKGIRSLKVFGKMTGGYFIATIINNALPFLLLPLLTRFLTPEDYSYIALFTAFAAIVSSLTGMSLEAYIGKYFFDHPKRIIAKIIGNGLLVLFSLNLAVCAIFFLTYNYLSGLYGLPLLWVLLIPANSFSYQLFYILLAILRNKKNVMAFSFNQISNTILNVAITVFLVVFLVFGWQGRLAGILMANILSSGFALFYLRQKGYLTFSIDLKTTGNILRFILTLIPNSLQSVIVNRIGIFFMQIYFTRELLGIFSVGFQISYVVMIIIITLNLSWTPFLFEQLSGKKEINKHHIIQMFYLHFVVVLGGFLFVNFASGLVLKIMTTEVYYEAEQFILWLTLGMLFNGLIIFIQPILIKYNRQKFLGVFSALNLIIMVLIHYVCVHFFAYMGIAYAYFLTYLIMFIVIFYKTEKTLSLPWLKPLKNK